MSRHLLFFVHGDPSVMPRYRDALAPLDVDIACVNEGALSSPYQAAGKRLRDPKTGRVFPRFRATYLNPTLAGRAYTSTSLVTFSAGYALARELFKHPEDRAAFDAYVALDSVHSDSAFGLLAPFEDFARAAKAGGAPFWLAHTDVPTTGYASTTQCARELVRRVGTGGNFVVRAYDTRPPTEAKNEHAAALTEWGPDFVAEALRPVMSADDGPPGIVQEDEDVEPLLNVLGSEDLNELALAMALYDLNDAAKALGKESALKVMDITECLCEAL